MKRGPRYNAYALLRESKLQSKRLKLDEDEQISYITRSEFTPVKKSVKFEESSMDTSKKRRSSVLIQSGPDFSSVIRKENWRPPMNHGNRIPKVEKCTTPLPAMSKREKVYGSATKMGVESRSGEKQQSGGRLMAMGRKSYASMEGLKGLSIAASSAINGENKGRKRSNNVLRKSTVFTTQFY